MSQIFLGIAAILAGLGVMGGAFASHALKGQLSEHALSIFETGIRYQMYHALALLLIGVLLATVYEGQRLFTVVGVLFIVGIAIFSGSLYALSLTGVKWLGAITPIGGVAFIVGWGLFAFAVFSLRQMS